MTEREREGENECYYHRNGGMSGVIEYKMKRYTNTYQELKLYNERLKTRGGRGDEKHSAN